MEEKFVLKEEFIKQAQEISRGAELLPGGVKELAIKLQKSKESGKPIRVKLGMDPTRPDLHLGHTVVMKKLKKFQELGHKIVLLVGGATAMVGDPSGKSETRPALTKEQVEENAKTYFEQMSKVLDTTKAEVVNNADWLHPMQLTDLLKLASNVTVAQMMTRDDFAKRYAEGKPISIHEFFYPLMQAYDSVAIDADIELGGTDQRFNVLLGREIQTAYGKPNPQMVMLLPLIEGTDGLVKMSKTYPEHCISLTDSAKDMYGKLMSIPDTLIIKYFSLLTDISDEELINNLNACLPQGIRVFAVTEPIMKAGKIAYARFNMKISSDNLNSDKVYTALKELLESEEIMLEKKSKSGYKTVDLKKSIKNYSLSEKCDFAELEIVLSAGSTDNANPNLIIKALENAAGEEFYADITREDLYNSDMELFR